MLSAVNAPDSRLQVAITVQVRVPIKKNAAWQLDFKEEVLETLLALLGIHHPTKLEVLPTTNQTINVKFPDEAAQSSGAVQLHETKDNRKYLSHGEVLVPARQPGAAPAPVARAKKGGKPADLTYQSILKQLGSEDPVVKHLYAARAKAPPVRKGTWSFNLMTLARDLHMNLPDLQAHLNELRKTEGLRITAHEPSYCVRLQCAVGAAEAKAVGLELWQRHTNVGCNMRDKVVRRCLSACPAAGTGTGGGHLLGLGARLLSPPPSSPAFGHTYLSMIICTAGTGRKSLSVAVHHHNVQVPWVFHRRSPYTIHDQNKSGARHLGSATVPPWDLCTGVSRLNERTV